MFFCGDMSENIEDILRSETGSMGEEVGIYMENLLITKNTL